MSGKFPTLIEAITDLGDSDQKRGEVIGRRQTTVGQWRRGKCLPRLETVAEHPQLAEAVIADLRRIVEQNKTAA